MNNTDKIENLYKHLHNQNKNYAKNDENYKIKKITEISNTYF